jgi:hypothetical protein
LNQLGDETSIIQKTGKYDMDPIKKLAISIIIMTIPLGLSTVYGQPFWTEKSTYIEGGWLYATGIATDVESIEKGRETAFQNGKQEIENLMQITNLTGVEILTQMTYEEDIGDKTKIYRLLKVNYDDIKDMKEDQLKSSKVHLEYIKNQKEKELELKEEEIQIKEAAVQEIKKNRQGLKR